MLSLGVVQAVEKVLGALLGDAEAFEALLRSSIESPLATWPIFQSSEVGKTHRELTVRRDHRLAAVLGLEERVHGFSRRNQHGAEVEDADDAA